MCLSSLIARAFPTRNGYYTMILSCIMAFLESCTVTRQELCIQSYSTTMQSLRNPIDSYNPALPYGKCAGGEFQQTFVIELWTILRKVTGSNTCRHLRMIRRYTSLLFNVWLSPKVNHRCIQSEYTRQLRGRLDLPYTAPPEKAHCQNKTTQIVL